MKACESRLDDTVCSLQQGKIKGQKDTDLFGKHFFSFLGIPYARPPVGLLRFKEPQPPLGWDGVRKATKTDNPSFTIDSSPELPFPIIGFYNPEDCLYLNVYTRQLYRNSSDPLRPVMVFIPGGFFMKNPTSRCYFGPEYLQTEDVVLVTISYRLGILGFLRLEDPSLEITGNAGLKDMVEALRWIQSNIRQFGGDADNVTIFGQGSGADAVHYLVLSPMAAGLFHKAIMQSGCALGPGAHASNAVRELLVAFKFPDSSERKMLEFLRKVPLPALLHAEMALEKSLSPSKKRTFGPCVEKKSENAFLCEPPDKLISSGRYNKVPMIFGYNNFDGVLEQWCKYCSINPNVDTFVPHFLDYAKNEASSRDINQKICQFYFGKNSIDRSQTHSLYTLLGDVLFVRGIQEAAKAHARTSDKPVYLYRLSVRTHFSYFIATKKALNISGACHGDDLIYLFKIRNPHMVPGCIEEQTIRRFASMWRNFAESGNPIPTVDPLLMHTHWIPVTPEEFHYLDIGVDLLDKTDPDCERMQFWDELHKHFTVTF